MALSMNDSTLWLLIALSEGRHHGYALLERVRELSEGRVELKVATLYATLDRLGESGWVVADGDEVVDGRLRRYFRLAAPGSTALEAELHRIEWTALQARKALGRLTAIGAGANR